METVQLRIFGRDLTLSCPSDEKEQLLKSAALLNEELDKISDKQNALVIAGLSLANKAINGEGSSREVNNAGAGEIDSLISRIESVL
jgi:cell division protein ZapA (FtsZ GTPase activity inhibitor)